MRGGRPGVSGLPREAARSRPRRGAPAEVVVSVRVARAERRPIAAEASTIGTIFPREQATVCPKIGGQIVQMRLLKNAVVGKGEVIAQLETRRSGASADARANLETARALYERRRALYDQGGIALKEVEAARLALTTAANAVRLAEDGPALGPEDSPRAAAPRPGSR